MLFLYPKFCKHIPTPDLSVLSLIVWLINACKSHLLHICFSLVRLERLWRRDAEFFFLIPIIATFFVHLSRLLFPVVVLLSG